MASEKKFNLKALNNQKVFLYIVVLGLLAFLAFYVFVVQKLEEQTRTLQAQNATLNTKVNELKEVYDNLAGYEEQIAAMDADIHERLSGFKADVREEDALIIAVDTLKKAYVEYTTININDKEEVVNIPAETVTKAGLADYNDAIVISKRTVAYVNNTDYINLKTIVDTILGYGGKKKINNIVYSKTEDGDDGYITGTIEVTDFIASGIGATYEAPDIKEYEAGLYDLFGIIKNPDK